MNNGKRAAKDVLLVASSRLASLLSGVAIGFLIPKMLSVEGYGFVRLFSLYSVYTALLHFGFVDGILLRYAGRDYASLEKRKFCTFTQFYIGFQLVIGLAMVAVSFFLPTHYSFILRMLGIFAVATNVTTYYQFLSQAVGRFAEYSKRDYFATVLKLLLVGGLCFQYFIQRREVSYRVYLLGLNAITVLLLLWYVFSYREITFGKGDRLSALKGEITLLFRTGIVLTIAYQTAHLIYALDSQFVSVLYDTEIFARYSFTYNITGMITTIVTSISVVMFPMLKKANRESAGMYFGSILTGLSIFSGLVPAVYLPVTLVVQWFLPVYESSMGYLRIVLPSIMLQLNIAVVLFTYAKVFDEQLRFFRNSLIVLAIGFLSNLIAHLVFQTPESISYASFVTMSAWYLIEGAHIGRIAGVQIRKCFFYLMILSIAFWAITVVHMQVWIQVLIYLVFYSAITLAFFRSALAAFINRRSA